MQLFVFQKKGLISGPVSEARSAELLTHAAVLDRLDVCADGGGVVGVLKDPYFSLVVGKCIVDCIDDSSRAVSPASARGVVLSMGHVLPRTYVNTTGIMQITS